MQVSTHLEAAWIAVDWGTTRLRAWAMSDSGAVLAGAVSECGMGWLSPPEFEGALLEIISLWLAKGRRTEIVICGMAGARQGWQEAPYRKVPCEPVLPGKQVAVRARDERLDVHIIPGLSQASPPDVMRGEETQLAGLLIAKPGFEGTACFPGTHSKWVTLGAGKVQRFRTFLTGEQFSLLAEHSILRHTVAADGWDKNDFIDAVREAAADPASVPGALFSLRAGPLLGSPPAGNLRSRLSGLLIGAEIGAVVGELGERAIHVVGGGAVAASYATALDALGYKAVSHDAAELTLAGISLARTVQRVTGT
ncbi:MAG: 2-dehydro-3-deoxygalactonokinase [Notoacmeibacter sp.]|nr:2-dehydro-3-deoxygalactonokinase [Notoacmeibacter sp.]